MPPNKTNYKESMRIFAEYMYEYGRFTRAIGKLEVNQSFINPSSRLWEEVGLGLKSEMNSEDLKSALLILSKLKALSPYIYASSKMQGGEKAKIGAQVESLALELKELFPR
jgi:hypothetical protein